MLRGLPASLILHAAIAGAGAIVLPTLARDVTAEVSLVPIDILSVSDLTNVAPAPRREVPEPEAEIPPPLEDFLEDLDTIPPDIPEPEPEPEPEAAEPPAPPPEPEPEPEPAPEPEAPEPEPDRPILAEAPADPLADILGDAENLFDRTPRDPPRQAPPAPAPERLEDEQPARSEARRGAGARTANTARVEALLTQQLFVCWDDVDDQPNPERLNVTLKMELNRDGTIGAGPTLVDPRRRPIGDRAMGVAIDRALRAARRCAPYRLPDGAAAYYDEWKEVTLNLGPVFRQ
ncbi:MAG: hypothetical protein AAGH87_07985 [Pseudomonadota bacterium]